MQSWERQPVSIPTRCAASVSPTNAWPEYPRPQMVRARWQNLNGLWEYALTAQDAAAPEQYTGQILVPYPLESAAASGCISKGTFGMSSSRWVRALAPRGCLRSRCCKHMKIRLSSGKRSRARASAAQLTLSSSMYRKSSRDFSPTIEQSPNCRWRRSPSSTQELLPERRTMSKPLRGSMSRARTRPRSRSAMPILKRSLRKV